jgi:hypothetical protein|tara:strand:+ start:8486 stop:8941 length:456 start_codon:yes stop_codon:yes gene_type:complete
MIWKTSEIKNYLNDIETLFQKTNGHKHSDNYLINPLFEHTIFARMGWDQHLVYYSAAIERPEYNGSIRIMSRHTRDRNYNFGTYKDDLKRGIETLDNLTGKAIELGYKDIWVSREESPKLLNYFAKTSKYDWKVSYETLHYGGMQYILRKI